MGWACRTRDGQRIRASPCARERERENGDGGTHVRHKRGQHRGLEPPINLAPKHRRGHVEPAPDLALREAVHVLREVVRELPALALHAVGGGREGGGGDDAEPEEERGGERGDERGGGAEPGLVHGGEGGAGGEEGRERGEGGEGWREVACF